jgi:high-affinity iron transporter
VQSATRTLSAFTAAPLSIADRSRQIEQLIRFARFESAQICGVGSAATADAADAASVAPTLSQLATDVSPGLAPAAVKRLRRAVAALSRLPSAAGVGAEDVPAPTSVSAGARELCASADADLQAVFPREWRQIGMDGDFDQVERYLNRMTAAVKAGDYSAAEAARARAYAAFEFGAELRLRAFDPAIASRVEGLFWAGAADGPDLVDLLSRRASARRIESRRDDLGTALEQGRIALQRSRSHTATMLNSAVVVFREGLEAALILAALSASFATGGARWRRPLVAGMVAAVPATLLTWVLTSAVVRSLASFGLQLEAALDLVAFVVLAIIMAWFFQRFCWTRFVAKTHARRRRRLLRRSGGSEAVAASAALAMFGFMIIYREGFETVVYLQALKLGAAGGAVLAGALLGLLVTVGLALLMLRLRRRLPYRRIVVVTAVAIGVLLVIMAGQGARAFQGAGWLGITPLDWPIPLWAGQWLGVFPSVETLVIQLLTAAAIPLGAELIRRHRDRRLRRTIAARRRPAARPAASPVSR